ncbi:MAG: lamin tail domain-containing protein [Bacteroidetes bacterium]|nr:lamin tail domain-containing protein [Bacteroidota bacterium]
MTTDFENHTACKSLRRKTALLFLKRIRKISFSFTIASILFFSIASRGQIVINEVGIAPSGGAGYQFIELFNTAGCAIDISCYTVVYNSNTGSGWTIKIPNGTTMVSGGFYLIGGEAGIGGVGVGSSGYPTGGSSSPYSGAGTVNLNIGNAAVFTNTTWMKSIPPGLLTNTGGQITLLNSTGTIVSSVSYNSGYVSGAYPMSSYTTCNPTGNTQGVNNILAPGAATKNVNGTFSGTISPGYYQGIYLNGSNNYSTEVEGSFSPGLSNVSVGLSQIASASPLSATASSNSPVCEYSTLNLNSTRAGGTASYSYAWNHASGLVSTFQNTSITNIPTAGSGVYTITVTDSFGCTASATTNVTIYNAATKFNVTGGGTYCSTTGAVIGLDGSENGVTYNLYQVGNGYVGNTITGTSGGGPISFNPVFSAGTYRVIATNTNNCIDTMNANAVININFSPAKPIITPVPGTTICEGGSVTFFGPVSSFTYQWYQGGTAISEANSNSYTTGTAGSYTLIVTSISNSCPSQASDPANITVNLNSTISLTSAAGTNNQSFCQGTTLTPITYAVGGGATGANVSGLPAGVSGSFSGGVFTISGTPTASGIFNYTVTTTGPCTNVSATGRITVNATPVITLTSPNPITVCSGENFTIS